MPMFYDLQMRLPCELSKPVETAPERAAPAAPTAAGEASPGCKMRTKEEGTKPTSPWTLATCNHPSTSCCTSTYMTVGPSARMHLTVASETVKTSAGQWGRGGGGLRVCVQVEIGKGL